MISPLCLYRKLVRQCDIVEEPHKLGAKIAGIKTLMLLLLAVSSWIDYLIFQNLNFIICKLELVLLSKFVMCKVSELGKMLSALEIAQNAYYYYHTELT